MTINFHNNLLQTVLFCEMKGFGAIVEIMQRKSAARCLPQLQSLRHLRTTVIKRPSRPVAKKINPIIQQLDTEVMLQKLPEVQIPTETTSSSTPAHIDDSTLGRSWTWVPPRKVEPEKEEKFFSIIPG